MENLLITAFNTRQPFIDHFKVFNNSLRINCPSQVLKVYVYSYVKEESVPYIGYLSNNVIPAYKRLECNEADLQSYMTFVRYKILIDILQNCPSVEKVAWIDVDTIIRGNISEFWNFVTPNSITLMDRFNITKEECGKVSTGFFGLYNDKYSRQLLEYCIHFCETEKKYYGMDQLAMVRAIKHFGTKINNLPIYLHDLAWDDDSKVWHARHGHIAVEKWVREYNKYL